MKGSSRRDSFRIDAVARTTFLAGKYREWIDPSVVSESWGGGESVGVRKLRQTKFDFRFELHPTISSPHLRRKPGSQLDSRHNVELGSEKGNWQIARRINNK